MKKLLLLLLVVLFLPLVSCKEVRYLERDTEFDYKAFVQRNDYNNKYTKRAWKYGYKKCDDGIVVPKRPPKYKVPDYLKNHPLLAKDNISVDEVAKLQYSKKDAIDFIELNYSGYQTTANIYHDDANFVDERIIGVTKDGIYFPLQTGTLWKPFSNLADSVLLTIQMRCENEHRKPTIHEKYLLLYIYSMKPYQYDNGYYNKYSDSIEYGALAENIFGILKIFIICLLALFCLALPAIVLLIIKRYTPEDSAIHKAISLIEWLIILVGGASLVKSLGKK